MEGEVVELAEPLAQDAQPLQRVGGVASPLQRQVGVQALDQRGEGVHDELALDEVQRWHLRAPSDGTPARAVAAEAAAADGAPAGRARSVARAGYQSPSSWPCLRLADDLVAFGHPTSSCQR